MLTDELDYELPADRIATRPAEPRDAARLMVVYRGQDRVEHHTVRDLPHLTDALHPDDLLVFNRSRVLPACFHATRADTGGKIKGLYLETTPDPDRTTWHVLLESRGRLAESDRLLLAEGSTLTLRSKLPQGRWSAHLHSPLDTLTLLHRIGVTPLPPYIQRQRHAEGLPPVTPADARSYNTVFARDPGSIAAPTAGLHFSEPLLAQLDHAGIQRSFVTLHVGLGTFAPVRTRQIEDHPIHAEWAHVPAATIHAIQHARAHNRRIIPVGTTSLRALESLPEPPPSHSDYAGMTRLFIAPSNPPFPFRFTDALLTNFHLPRSTLLALVAALPGVGIRRLLDWYQLAIDAGYRFYSYGDAMLIL